MKKINLFLGLIIGMIMAMSSCTMEKRVYMSGYYTDWKGKKHIADSQELTSNAIKKQTERNNIMAVAQSESEKSINDMILPVTDNNMTASIDNPVMIPLQKQVLFSKKKSVIPSNTKLPLEKKENIFKNKLTEKKSSAISDDGGGIIALRILGWILWAIGLLYMLFLSILGGALLCALGILFIWLGKKKKGGSSSENSKVNSSNYDDVIYLKNGSIIHGLIIEQVPNVSIKIKTKDGNVFVYKIEDIEKMTKESSK